jgi:hypothetical protein
MPATRKDQKKGVFLRAQAMSISTGKFIGHSFQVVNRQPS